MRERFYGRYGDCDRWGMPLMGAHTIVTSFAANAEVDLFFFSIFSLSHLDSILKVCMVVV